MVKQHLIAYPANVGDVVIVVYHAVQPLPFSIGAQVSSQHQLELIFMCGTDESLHILPLVCQQTGMKAKVLLFGYHCGWLHPVRQRDNLHPSSGMPNDRVTYNFSYFERTR